MKKIPIILVMALFITSCSIFQEKKENTKANLEWQIKVSQLQKWDAKVQKIVKDFAPHISLKKTDIKATTFEWETENWSKEIEWFWVKNEKFFDRDWGYAKFFDTWEVDNNNVADGPWAGVMGYKKDNIVCFVSDSINATIEQIQTEDDLSKYWSTVEVSCWKLAENTNKKTNFKVWDKWIVSDLQKKLWFQIGNGELEDMWYNVWEVDNDYYYFWLNTEIWSFGLVIKKLWDKYEKVWEGQDVSDSDCEILEEKYNDIFTYEDFPFSNCLARLEKFIPTKENLEKVSILRSALKNFEIKDIDWAVPSNFLWKQNWEEYIVDWYKISFKKFEKTFEFDKLWWKEDKKNAITQEKLVIRWFEKDNEVCLVEYYIREGNSDIWAYADITLSCGKFDKKNKVNQKEKCQNYLTDVFYTSEETKEYINKLNEQKAKNRESDIWIIDYIFEWEKLELSDWHYYAIKEIHRDSKDSETREVTTRHYKHDWWLWFYEYDVVSDNYKKLNTENKYLEEYKNNCVK